MTTATLRISTSLPVAGKKAEKGLFWRLYDAFAEARLRAAMREIRRHQHLIPQDVLKQSGYIATASNDSAYPFTR